MEPPRLMWTWCVSLILTVCRTNQTGWVEDITRPKLDARVWKSFKKLKLKVADSTALGNKENIPYIFSHWTNRNLNILSDYQ